MGNYKRGVAARQPVPGSWDHTYLYTAYLTKCTLNRLQDPNTRALNSHLAHCYCDYLSNYCSYYSNHYNGARDSNNLEYENILK